MLCFTAPSPPGTVSLPRSKSAAAAKTRPRALGAPPGARGWSRQQRSPVSQGWSPPEGEVVPSSPPGMCLSGFLSLPPPPAGSPNTYVAVTPLSSRRTAPSGRGRQSPGCRVIGPFKRKLSAAGNKTLPFNSGIIRSGREPSRGKAFIEKRWENEI